LSNPAALQSKTVQILLDAKKGLRILYTDLVFPATTTGWKQVEAYL